MNVTYSCASEFTLPGSNGYRITVSAEPSDSGPADIQLSAEGRNATVVYGARGTATRTSMKASFGRLGRVSLRFRPSGKVRRVKVPKKCLKERPPVVTARLGTYVGTIRFRGERGYTKVSAHHVNGGIGDPLANTNKKLRCEKPVTNAQTMRELKEVALSASAQRAGIAFQASRLPVQFSRVNSPAGASIPKQDHYLFWVFAGERAERMSIFRSVAAGGPASDFVFDDALASATVSPPLPFVGSGSFLRSADGSTSWTGSLRVPVPGLGTVRLTEPGFQAELATLAMLLQQAEEEAKVR